jgi:arginase
MQAKLLGIPLDLGAKNLGVDVGPDAFRYRKLIEKLKGIGIDVEDLGDITCKDRNDLNSGDPKLRYLDEIVRVSEEVARTTDDVVASGKKVIAVGGDHSINLGLVAGASTAVKGDIGMIYLDAHGDMNTDKTTMTGNIHGMHLASLMGFGAPQLSEVYGQHVKLDKANLLHIGGCDIDQGEIDLIESEDLDAYTLLDIMSYGLGPLLEKIDLLTSRVGNIWVSLDLDVIDRMYAPGAGMPNAGGLTYREIAAIAEYVGQKANVIGIDVVEYNPLQDQDHKTAELGIELIAKFLGKNYSWYTNYLEQNKL